MEGLRKAHQKALNDPKQEVNFKTKHLNQWVDAPTVWIKDDHYLACNFGTLDNRLYGHSCFAGLDLASHVDINSLQLYFPDIEGRPVVRSYFWIPESKVVEKQDRVDYRAWAALGLITIVPGDVIDIDYLTDEIKAILARFEVQNLAFDPARAFHGVVQNLQKANIDYLSEYPQTIKYMSAPMREVENMVTAHAIDFNGNPVMRWMLRNLAPYTDANDNIRPDKKHSRDKIDGWVALINAVGGKMSIEAEDGTGVAYSNHTLRTL